MKNLAFRIELAIFNAWNRVLRRCCVLRVLHDPFLVGSNSFNTTSPSRGEGWNETNPGITGVKYNPSAPYGSPSNPYKPLPKFTTDVYAKIPEMVNAYKTTGTIPQLSGVTQQQANTVKQTSVSTIKVQPANLSTVTPGTQPVQLSTLPQYQTKVIEVKGIDAATTQKLNEITGNATGTIVKTAASIAQITDTGTYTGLAVQNAVTGALSSLTRPGNISQIDATKTLEYMKTITGTVDESVYGQAVKQQSIKIADYVDQAVRSFDSIKNVLTVELGNNADATKSLAEIGGYNLIELGKQATTAVKTLNNNWGAAILAAEKAKQEIENAIIAKITGKGITTGQAIVLNKDLPKQFRETYKIGENGATDLHNIATELLKYIADGNTLYKLPTTFDQGVRTIRNVQDMVGDKNKSGSVELSFFVNVVKGSQMLATGRNEPTEQIKIVQRYNTVAEAEAAQRMFIDATNNNHGTMITQDVTTAGKLKTQQISRTAGYISEASASAGATKITYTTSTGGQKTVTIREGAPQSEINAARAAAMNASSDKTINVNGTTIKQVDYALAAKNSGDPNDWKLTVQSAQGTQTTWGQEINKLLATNERVRTSVAVQDMPTKQVTGFAGLITYLQDHGKEDSLITKGLTLVNSGIVSSENRLIDAGIMERVESKQMLDMTTVMGKLEFFGNLIGGKSVDEAMNTKTITVATEKGVSYINNKLVEAATTGKMSPEGGLTSHDLSMTALKLATEVNSATNQPKYQSTTAIMRAVTNTDNGQKWIAERAYDPTTSEALLNAVGTAAVQRAVTNQPLTAQQKNDVTLGVIGQGLTILTGSELTGYTAFDLAVAPFTVLNLGIGKGVKAADNAVEAIVGLSKLSDAAKTADGSVIGKIWEGAGKVGMATMAIIPTPKEIANVVNSGQVFHEVKMINGVETIVTTAVKNTNAGEIASQITRQTDQVIGTTNLGKVADVVSVQALKDPAATTDALTALKISEPSAYQTVVNSAKTAPNTPGSQAISRAIDAADTKFEKIAEEVVTGIAKSVSPDAATTSVIKTYGEVGATRLVDSAMTTMKTAEPVIVKTSLEVLTKPTLSNLQNAPANIIGLPADMKGTTVVPAKFDTYKLGTVGEFELQGLYAAKYNDIRDIAALPTSTSQAAIKNLAAEIGTTPEKMVEIVREANQYLKNMATNAELAAKRDMSATDLMFKELQESIDGAVSKYDSPLNPEDVEPDYARRVWENAKRAADEISQQYMAKSGAMKETTVRMVERDGKLVTESRQVAADAFREKWADQLPADLRKDIDRLLDTNKLPSGTNANTMSTGEWCEFKQRIDKVDVSGPIKDSIADELGEVLKTYEDGYQQVARTVIDRVARNDVALNSYVKDLPADLQKKAERVLTTGEISPEDLLKIVSELEEKDAVHFIGTLKTAGFGAPHTDAATMIERALKNKDVQSFIGKTDPLTQKTTENALRSGYIDVRTVENLEKQLTPDEFEKVIDALKTVPAAGENYVGPVDTISNVLARVAENNIARSTYLDNLSPAMRAVAENALSSGGINIEDLGKITDALKNAGPDGMTDANHFVNTLQMEGAGVPVIHDTGTTSLIDELSKTITGLPTTSVLDETADAIPKMDEFGRDTRALPTDLPIIQKENGLIVPKTDIPNTPGPAGAWADEMESALKNSPEYNTLNAADKKIVDDALAYGHGDTTEVMKGDVMGGEVITDKEALRKFRDFTARNPIVGKTTQFINDANMFAMGKGYVSFDSFNDAAKALAKDDFNEAAKTLSKLNGQESKNTLTGDFYFNKTDSALKNADVSQIRALKGKGVSDGVIKIIVEKRAKMAIENMKNAPTDVQKAFGKAMAGEKLNLTDAEKLYNSGLNNEIDNALAGSRMAEETQTSEIYAKSLKEELLSRLVNEEPIGDIKNKLDDLLDQAKKDDLECKKMGRDCSGGLGGGGSAAGGGGSSTSKAAIVATATAAAAGATLVTGGQANVSPGQYDITNNVFNTLALDYRTGMLQARPGTTRGAGSQTFENEGYDGKTTIKVEGDQAGLDNLNKALNWMRSDANTIVKDNTRREATLDVTTNPDGSMTNEMSLGGRGLTYECEQFTLDTAQELEAIGVKDVFVAILGSGKEGTTNMAHAVVAVKTGEKVDLTTDKTYPEFVLLEPQTQEGESGRIVGMVGSGDPITTLGDALEVTDIQLISPSAFLDYKGTRGILMPEKGDVYQYSDVPTMELEISPFLMSTTEQMGDALSPERLAAEVAAGTLTQEDADRINNAMRT